MNRATRRAFARSGHTPRRGTVQASPTAWDAAIVRSRETDAGIALDINIKLRTAFHAMRSGQGTEDDYITLACAMNVGLMRAERIAPSLEATMLDGQRALLDCAELSQRHGRFGFTGPGLQAMDAALDAYEAIVGASTPNQMQQALHETIARMQRGDYIQIESNAP